jgi:single-strand DNA-binding protein
MWSGKRRHLGALPVEADMSNETTTTVAGNLTADPELRVTPTGRAVALFTVASTTRVLDATTGEWRDGGTLFLRCTAWRRLAENVAESLRKGTRVVVIGRLQQRTYETDDGQKRATIDLVAEEVSVSLRHAIVRAIASPARTEADRPATSSEPAGRALP